MGRYNSTAIAIILYGDNWSIFRIGTTDVHPDSQPDLPSSSRRLDMGTRRREYRLRHYYPPPPSPRPVHNSVVRVERCLERTHISAGRATVPKCAHWTERGAAYRGDGLQSQCPQPTPLSPPQRDRLLSQYLEWTIAIRSRRACKRFLLHAHQFSCTPGYRPRFLKQKRYPRAS